MGKKPVPCCIPPYIINVNKPVGMSSQEVVRTFKRSLPKGFGKIGHFGTLDPFAQGVLMIGLAGAARLNEYVHAELPKTYMAYGKLGVETDTGDLTSEPSQIDNSEYFRKVISTFSREFIEKCLREKFMGEYFQAPHKYSAAKFQGKNLHQWAREGVEIKKEKKRRFIYDLRVRDYAFPLLKIEFRVSSGTYIRTLFSECSNELGTIGHLEGLERTKVGHIGVETSLTEESWPKINKSWSYEKEGIFSPPEVLPYPEVIVSELQAKRFLNGNSVEAPGELGSDLKAWIVFQEKILGLGIGKMGRYFPKIVFPTL